MLNGYVFRVTEKKDPGNTAEPGEPFEAFNLSEVKRISTRRQKVKGSVLVLEPTSSQSRVRSGTPVQIPILLRVPNRIRFSLKTF